MRLHKYLPQQTSAQKFDIIPLLKKYVIGICITIIMNQSDNEL